MDWSGLLVPIILIAVTVGLLILGKALFQWYTGMTETHRLLKEIRRELIRSSWVQVRLHGSMDDPGLVKLETDLRAELRADA